jgi:ectoine hydroxylase-related dioxygenase (phytanoyl-CoA dioxygenase family)
VRATGEAGTMAIFDPRVWHAAGINTTDNPRRVLTISFTRPNHKPQFDFVRNIGEEKMATMSKNLKQLIGYYSRVPADHKEWYQDPEDRYYQMDQG